MQKTGTTPEDEKIIMRGGTYTNSTETPRDVYITLPREP